MNIQVGDEFIRLRTDSVRFVKGTRCVVTRIHNEHNISLELHGAVARTWTTTSDCLNDQYMYRRIDNKTASDHFLESLF